MRRTARALLAAATWGAVVASLAYEAFALAQVRAFARRPPARQRDDGAADRSVTVLKPLHGDEPGLAENLRTFCEQDYERFDVVLGTRGPNDGALRAARRVAALFPGRVRVVTGDESTPRHANPKIATLAAILPHARGDVLLISDSDMRVDRGYVRAVGGAFADPAVGAATCLYRGEAAAANLASLLGAQANHEIFAPSALVARALLPKPLCFGATMAVRRSVLEGIGGLDALGPFLADDARLGELVAERGLRVVLSHYVVENLVCERGLRELWDHELRWARTHRTLEPRGFLGVFLTYPVALALLHLLVAPRRAGAAALLGAALALRFALAFAARRAFGVRSGPRLALVALRDVLGFAVWAASFFAREVRWRGDAFTVLRDGRLQPIER